MKIKEIIIKDFGGIETKIIQPDKCTFFLGENGTAKTTILNAIKRAFLGKMEEKDIRKGASYADVTLIFEDDTSIERIRKADRSVVKVNDKKTTDKSAKEFLEQKLGASMDIYESMFGVDYFKDISKNDLSALILSMLHVNIDTKTIIETAENEMDVLDSEVKKYLVKEFPTGCFGIDTIDEVSSRISKRLTEEKRLLENYKQKSIFEGTLPKESREELEQMQMANLQKIAEINASMKQIKMVEQLENQKNAAIIKKQELQKEYDKMKEIVQPDQNIYDTAVNDKQKFERAIMKATNNVSMCRANINFSSQIINSIKQSDKRCPICTDIICNTDLSPYLTQAEQLLHMNQKTEKENLEFIEKCRQQISKRDAALQSYQMQVIAYTKKESLKQQLVNIIIPQIPEKPIINSNELALLEEQKKIIQNRINALNGYAVAEEFKKKYREQQDKVDVLKIVTRVLDVKTGVRSMIIKRILTPFQQACNSVLNKMETEEEFLFSYDKGIDIYMKKGKDKPFVPVSDLSTGEFVIAAFVLMSVIGQLTQSKTLVLDNLDSLDNNNLAQLINLLKNDDTFDNVFLAAVNHDDTKRTLAQIDEVQVIDM